MARLFLHFFLVQMSFAFSSYAQEEIQVNLKREVDTAVTTFPQSMTPKEGTWEPVYPKLKIEQAALDSIDHLHAYIDYFQTIFQAYKEGNMSKEYVEHQIDKWGLDSLVLTAGPIKSYFSAVMAMRGDTPVVIIDMNNDRRFADESSYKNQDARGIHTILFERYDEGRIRGDSAIILIENVDYIDKSIDFRYVEKRVGEMVLNDKKFDIVLEAKLNDYLFHQFATITIKEDSEFIGSYGLHSIIQLDDTSAYQITSISPNGEVMKLKKYTDEKRYSFQVGDYLPMFGGASKSGKYIELGDFKGQYTLVYFWNSTCAASTLVLKKYVNRLMSDNNTGITLLSVALDRPENIESAEVENEVLIIESANGPINRLFDIKVYPSYFFINPEGKILLKSEIGINTGTFVNEIRQAILEDKESI